MSVVSIMLPSFIETVVLPLFAVILLPALVPPGFLSALVFELFTVASLVMMYSPPFLRLSTLTYLSTTGAITVTVHVAVLLPSSVVTVIVAVPAAIAVTIPLSLTVATLGSLLLHVTALFVASEGVTVAVSCTVSPISSVFSVGSTLTPVTSTVG